MLFPVVIILGAIGAYWVFLYAQKVKLGLAYGDGETFLICNLAAYAHYTGHLPHDIGGLSWRVELLRANGHEGDAALFKKFHLDEPWDSPHNKPLVEQIPWWLQDPEGKKGHTCWRGVQGKNCAFDDGKEVKPPAKGEPALVAVVMTKDSCPWTKPVDAPVADVENGRSIRWFKGDGYYSRADAHEDGRAIAITATGSPTGWRRLDPHARPPLRFTPDDE